MKRIHELEDKIAQQKTECSSLQTDHDNILKEFSMKDQSQNIELLTLTKACEMQKDDIEILTRENVEYQKYNKELIEKHKEDMLQLEGELNDERTSLKEKLHEVSNIRLCLVNLLPSILLVFIPMKYCHGYYFPIR